MLSLAAYANAELTLRGKLWSMTSDYFVMVVGNRLYSVKREKISSNEQAMLEKNPRDIVTIHAPIQAIDDIKRAPASATVKY